MADPDTKNAISSTFPPPPPFWKDFTAENVARIEDLKQEQAERDGVADASAVRLVGLPSSLCNLQPPLEPDNGEWRAFGGTYKLNEKLPELDGTEIRRLFPPPSERDQDGKHFDRATILKRLAKSLILNFLELMGVFAINPNHAVEKITDLRDLFYNFHYLVNEYRPHQARESLISLMQAQLDKTRAETNAIRDVKEKVERILEGLGSLKMDDEAVDGLGEKRAEPWSVENDVLQALAD